MQLRDGRAVPLLHVSAVATRREEVRVLIVNAAGAEPSVGGTEKHLERLGRLMPGHDHEVWYLTGVEQSQHAPGPEFVLRRPRIGPAEKVVRHARDSLAFGSQRLERAIATAAPDVVHTHNLIGMSTAVWAAAERVGIPVVHTAHDYYLRCPRSTLLDRAGRACDETRHLACTLRARLIGRWQGSVRAFTANTRYLLDAHAGLFPSAARHLIGNPLEVDSALGSLVSAPGLRRLGYIGRLDSSKGVHLLLDAAPALRSRGIQIWFAGSGKLEETVSRLARESPDVVRYVGVVTGTEKREFIEQCDAGIMPSVWPEPGGPPNAMIEWTQAGRPVLSTSAGGLREAIEATPGVLEIRPTVDGVLDGVDRLRAPATWKATVERLSRTAGARTEQEWIRDYVAVYCSVLGGTR